MQLGYNGKLEWYHFDEAGYMQTGWLTDKDQNRYFLHNVSDGTQGHMVTGWYLVAGKWYYFNPVSDGTRGALFVNRTVTQWELTAYGCPESLAACNFCCIENGFRI